jgi:hypothetical protein
VQNTARSSVWFPFYVRRSRRLGHVQSDSLDASPGSTSQDLTSFAAPSFPWGSAKGRYLPSALTTPAASSSQPPGLFRTDEMQMTHKTDNIQEFVEALYQRYESVPRYEVEEAIRAERERCAKIAENYLGAGQIADEIRRGG